MAEYILYYVKETNCENPFIPIIKERMKDLNLKQTEISEIILSKNGNKTGWFSNILKGLYLPTENVWNKLKEKLQINNNFDNLKYEYKNLIYTFNNQKQHHSVWNYNIEEKVIHPTQKPIELLKNIILHSSNENEIVLDYCMGSGSCGIACLETNRNFIGIEKDEKFFNKAQNWILNKEKELLDKTKNRL